MTLFVVTTPASQSVEEQRQLIRSHVMRGRNRKKPPSRPPSWIDGRGVETQGAVIKRNTCSLSAKIGGEFSFAPPLAEFSPELLGTAWDLKHGMSPLEFDPASSRPKEPWFDPVWNDSACLHFTIYVTKVYTNLLHGREQNSGGALVHFITTLSILQQRISYSREHSALSDSTILVVVGLVMLATACGDLEIAQNHLAGLAKMVMLRGGISAFHNNRELQAKICRADLGVALSTGCKPLFFSNGISWELYLAPQPRKSIIYGQFPTCDQDAQVSCISQFLRGLDPRLGRIWGDVSEVVRAANLAIQCKRSIDIEIYREVLISVHYRLISLFFDLGGAQELIRLGLLAFASTLFLQWRGVKTNYADLSLRLRDSIHLETLNGGGFPVQVMLWLNIVAGVSVPSTSDQSKMQAPLAQLLHANKIRSWKQTRESLKSVLWVDDIHDAVARGIVETALLKELV
ncbi:hypothetical protein BGZ63DRAFT_79872 [Mariannaea sp. PMI_226]|nr:hypothetical protein BGZ63DRAFT_79872 [Mariannaea sp. PMI_226]